MQRSGPKNYPADEKRLADFGERLRLARLRRKFSTEMVAKRAGISRSTLMRVEKGEPAVTLGTYMRVLSVLGFTQDIDLLAKDDELGRKLQDLALPARKGEA